jgi:hypothetical protein
MHLPPRSSALALGLLAALATPAAPAVAGPPAGTQAGKAGNTATAKPSLSTKLGTIPEHNKAIYFGYKGHVDTDVKFPQFFGDDHTLMGWFMPQYPFGNIGPIFTEVGPGTFTLGQGDYRWGDGGFQDAGKPVLFLEIGDRKVIYLVPSWQAGKWRHVAVVRKGDVFSLFVDGVKQTPIKVLDAQADTVQSVAEIDISTASGTPSWATTLRFGRRPKEGASDQRAYGQSYGVLDDVAVFDYALTGADIGQVMAAKRLTGWEKGLVAGWSFEKPLAGKPLPPKLQSSWTQPPRTYHVPVSDGRSHTADAKTFDNILIIGEASVAARLPFKKGEAWRVVQGMGEAGGSHNGYAAFAYDFVLASGSGGNYPGSTKYAPIQTAGAGKLMWYRKSGTYEGHEPFKMGVRVGPDEHFSYQHLAPDSLNGKATGGTFDAADDLFRFDLADAPAMAKGEQVGLVGPNAAHLHFSGSGPLKQGMTFPVAFTDYEASDDQGQTWHHVVRGHPKKGQWIKRE